MLVGNSFMILQEEIIVFAYFTSFIGALPILFRHWGAY